MASHENLDIDEVIYDLNNPRIAPQIENWSNIDHELVGLALQPADAKFNELKTAIYTNKGLINSIIVNRESGQNIVIEGNTRLAIYKQFHEDDPEDSLWQTIPAIVYENMNDRQINAIRLQAHLVGVREWTPFAKAKYLHELHNNDHLSVHELVEFCGGNKNEVLRNIAAFKQMDEDYRSAVPSDQFDERKYSLFYEAQKPKIQQAIVTEGFKKKNFINWVVDGKFEPRQELVRLLPKILKTPRAREVFLKEGADKASKFIDRPELAKELLEATLIELCYAVQEKIKIVQYQEIIDIERDEDSKDCLSDTEVSLHNFIEHVINH